MGDLPRLGLDLLQADPWRTNAREEAYYLLGLDVPWKDGKPWRSTESGEIAFDRCGKATMKAAVKITAYHV